MKNKLNLSLWLDMFTCLFYSWLVLVKQFDHIEKTGEGVSVREMYNEETTSCLYGCHEEKIITAARNTNTRFVCWECQCPPCLKCGKRADDADSKAFSLRENYYCEECKGDHKQKQCKKCERWKNLTCYPESVREAVVQGRQGIQNKHHWCSKCIAQKETNSEDLMSKWLGEKQKKQCSTCGKWKTLDAYPEKTRATLVNRKRLDHGKHACSKCVG